MSYICSDTDTITAIATPSGNGGVGIIRISGDSASTIASKIINKELSPRYATLVKLSIPNITDTAIAIYFPNPNSFTGEDVVELQMHGGTLLIQTVLDHVISLGARLANPGEFTKRALLNGKITLLAAENISNLIHAESDMELLTAGSMSSGELHEKIVSIEKQLVNISAQLEAALDHPEEVEIPSLESQIKSFIAILSQYTDNAKQSNYIYDGINVAILGEPNAGKSSLFNALLGSSRSIVTDIAGTTTDIVSETLQIGGYKIRLVDTAGIRNNPRDQIEQMGIDRTRLAAQNCDFAIIFDNTALALIQNKPHIKVTRSTTVEQIKSEILKLVPSNNSKHIANRRQLNELCQSQIALTSALESAKNGDTADLIASDIATALFHISNITGTNAGEAVLDEIFSRFCLGK